ncbi:MULTISPECIES: STAS domain-containing protein [Streptomyces]|uniref:Anti-sigma factor antagonist n=1 Tax=Streptomyces rhizosphaericola TaxID=2564098 RepID=A0ABY2PM39_9ACTN|nr:MULTISPECIES: STAS domain-containing protein [Streptomyces]ARI51646.1 anti-anti-sigma factor [Streptomyces sp. S8]MYU01598.1 STAS domain-containing protein [Streptomyces sp. SID8350]PWS39648.1 anti-sigma factor antagonist [Streptomyces sp. ZEA17I]TGZ12099.1 anti-sigma factor antagonist [Streptomyces rhizosphaericola]SCK26555.1 anti-anti-sigma factor [Streptomyces sp. AmelKG-D3]
MTTPLTLTASRRPDGTSVLTAVGEIDMSNCLSLAAALDDAPGPLVLDLSDVEYLDSAGLSVLFPHAERLELIAGPLLEPVLTISGLTDLTTHH